VQQRFGVLSDFDTICDEDIKIAIERLVNSYSTYIFRILFRILSVICWYKEQSKKYIRTESRGIAQHIFKLLHTNGVYSAFPITEVIFRMYLSLMSANCSGERSFSQLARSKNVQRFPMSQDRLGVLALLCIEKKLLHETDFSSVIDEFTTIKSRKVTI